MSTARLSSSDFDGGYNSTRDQISQVVRPHSEDASQASGSTNEKYSKMTSLEAREEVTASTHRIRSASRSLLYLGSDLTPHAAQYVPRVRLPGGSIWRQADVSAISILKFIAS